MLIGTKVNSFGSVLQTMLDEEIMLCNILSSLYIAWQCTDIYILIVFLFGSFAQFSGMLPHENMINVGPYQQSNS